MLIIFSGYPLDPTQPYACRQTNGVPIKLCRFRNERQVPIKVPINIRGPDRDILILLLNLKIFYFALGLTKTSFFSNFLTERARQVQTLFSCILIFDISQALSKFLMYDIPFISMMALRSIGSGRRDVDVTANNVEIMTLRQCRQEVAGPKMLTSRRQDRRLIDTDKLNGVTDYKWNIYFYYLNFYRL